GSQQSVRAPTKVSAASSPESGIPRRAHYEDKTLLSTRTITSSRWYWSIVGHHRLADRAHEGHGHSVLAGLLRQGRAARRAQRRGPGKHGKVACRLRARERRS